MRARRSATAAGSAVAGVFVVMGLGACTPDLPTLAAGDCLDLTDEAYTGFEVEELPTADCSTEHDGQVVGTFDLDGSSFPGQDEIEQTARTECSVLFEEFIGVAPDSSTLAMTYISPTEDTWNEADDRLVMCIAALPEGSTTESLEGSEL